VRSDADDQSNQLIDLISGVMDSGPEIGEI